MFPLSQETNKNLLHNENFSSVIGFVSTFNTNDLFISGLSTIGQFLNMSFPSAVPKTIVDNSLQNANHVAVNPGILSSK